MERFTDSDGDEWVRGEEHGEVIIGCTVWRLVTDEVMERRDIDEDDWRQSTIDEYPNTGPCMLAAIAALWPETDRPNLAAPPILQRSTPRRIIQLHSSGSTLAALCDDGTAWLINPELEWLRLPPIPQDTP